MSSKRTPAALRAIKDESGVRFKPNPITAALLASFGVLPGWAQANDITLATGWTGTTIGQENNGVTEITSQTIRGNAAFNQFGKFTVDQNKTVNLVVPTDKTLINLVHDAKVQINGTLNGIQGNKIGGNVIFADPHGMVVGAQGVVNVGSLTVTTPSADQMKNLADVANSGSSDAANAAVSDLQAGKYNAGAGELTIQGQIKSAGSINLFAASAIVGQGAKVDAGAAIFGATVNTDGLVDASAAVHKDGSIQIVANNKVEIGGELAALMADNRGGNVTIKAPNITLKGTGNITTRALTGGAKSGDISLQAASDISFTGRNADGTAIADLDKLQSAIKAQAKPLLASNLGKAKVVIEQGAKLDAGHTDASKAGNIKVEALGVDKQLGGYADASATIDVAGQLIGKDISLRAVSDASVSADMLGSLLDTTTLKADIARLKDLNKWSDEQTWAYLFDTLGGAVNSYKRTDDLGLLMKNPENFSELAALLPYVSASIAQAEARISVAGSADLQASGTLDMRAESSRFADTSTWSVPILNGKLPFNFGLAYGRLSGATTVEVLSGAKLAAHDLVMLAHSDNELAVSATSVNSHDGNGNALTTMGLAFGMAHTDLTTTAKVASGAQLDIDNDVSVNALTEQDLSNGVSFKAIGEGASGGPAIALTLFNSKTLAAFDANLSGARHLNVTAANLVSQQDNSATVQVGKSSMDHLKASVMKQEDFKKFTDGIATKVKGFFGMKPGEPTQPTESKFRLASALAIGIADHKVEAIIGSSGAPTLDLSGDVAVAALQQQSALHNSADSTVNANVDKGDGTKTAISIAASYNQLSQQTRALIGDGVSITAAHIGLDAHNVQSLDLGTLTRWGSLSEVFTNLKGLATSLPEIPGQLSTVYANSTSESEEFSLAGSLTVLNTDIDALAWVGDNVSLTATSTDDGWSTTPFAVLAKLVADGKEDEARKALREMTWKWTSPLQVQARNEIEQLAIAGNLWWSLFNNTSDGKAAGAGLNVQVSDNDAVAGIGANGNLNARKVAVNAEQDELIIGITPTAGKGASAAGTGSLVVSVVDSNVRASIHSSTNIDAAQVGVTADHRLGLWSAAGALAASETTGVGASVAVNVLTTDVQALVGNNSAWRPVDWVSGGSSTVKGQWKVDEVLVDAQSSGQSGAFSVAAALARTEKEQAAQDQAAAEEGKADSGAMSLAEGLGKAVLQALFGDTSKGVQSGLDAAKGGVTSVKDTIVSVPDKLGEVWGKVKGLFDEKPDPGTGNKPLTLAVTGSASVNVSGQKTRARLGDILLDPRDPQAKGSKVTVLSLNQTNQLSGSGSGALTLAGGQRSERSSALAGAIAYNHLFNVTESLLQNATLTGNDSLAVQAASAGDQVAMGLGLAAATAGNDNTAVALSASGGVIMNTTRAAVVDSSIAQREDGSEGIAVTAYDRARVLLGGGAFSFASGANGSGTSAGGSLVFGLLMNKLQAEWLGSTATDFARLDVSANSAARVLAGAIAGAVSTGSSGKSGSGAITLLLLDNDVAARVDKSLGHDSSLQGGAVNVNAQSVSGLAALDGVFEKAGLTALSKTGLDLDGKNTVGQIKGSIDTKDGLFDEDGKSTSTTSKGLFDGELAGEAVLAVAGNLAATSGQTAVGGAVSIVYTGSDYKASLANTDVDLSGDLKVVASNNTDVLAAAIGAAGAKENAVSGSSTVVIARGSVSADVDMSGRTLTADDLLVRAYKSGGAYSLAGNITGSANNASIGGAVALSDMQQSASATVNGGTYALGGDAEIGAGLQSRIITAALSGQVSGSGSAIGGALTYNRIADTTSALLSNARMSADNLRISASQPDLGASIWAIAFNLSAAGGAAGVGGAVAVNLIDANRSAGLTGSTVNLDGAAELSSSLDGEIWGLGVDAAGGNTAGVGGSIVVNVIDGEDEVLVADSTLTSSADDQDLTLDASAGNGLTIASLTGSIKGGGTAAVGGAISVNRIGADRVALIRNANISGFSSAELKSGAKQDIYAIAVAGGGAGTVAVNGSSTSNVMEGTERAAIEGGTLDVGSLKLSAAIGERTIWSLAGAISGAGTVAVGVANSNNIILATREARISNATLTLSGALSVESGGSANIRSAAVGAGGAGTAAVGGSVAVNVVDGEENASLSNVTLTRGSGVTVQVTRGDVDIKTLAGNVQGAGTAAVGAAVAVSTIDQQRSASIANSSLTLSGGNTGIAVNALTQASIQTLAISGAGGGTAGVALSNTSNNINAVTRAKVSDSTGSASSLTVSARDGSSIESLAGGVGLGGTAGVGVATAVNRIANDIEAHLSGSKNNSAWALNDVKVSAESDARILTSSISGAASGTAGVAAGVATNLLQTKSRALIDGGALLLVQNNVGVIAYNRDTIQALASAVAASGNAGVSGLVTVNFIESKTEAGIGGATTRVTALGKGAGLSVDGGALQNAPDASTWADPQQFNPVADLKTTAETVRGIAVRATSLQQVGQLASSIGVSLVPISSAAVSGLSNTTVLGGSTTAYVDEATLNGNNTGASSTQQVSLGAAAHSYNFGGLVSGALSLGAAAVAATIDTGVVSRSVTARINKATVNSLGETAVRATSTQVSSDIVSSAAGGIVGVGGSGGVLILKGTTQALVAPGSVLNVGALKVAASATNRLSPNTGSISGGAVGVGAGLGFGYNQSTVRAWVGQTDTGASAPTTRTTVNSKGAVNITADSSTGILANSISASGGGVAVAGATNLILLENVTEAGARFTDFGSSGSRAASLTIHAKDTLNALLNAGSAGVGAVSVGGSANVLVTNNATRAQLLDSSAWLSGALTVEGLREVSAGLNTLNGGASANASIGGALGLLLLGSGAVAHEDDGQSYDATGELNKDGKGTLSLANSFGTRSNADTHYQTSSVDADGKVTVVSTHSGVKTGDEEAVSDRLDSATQYSSLDNRFTTQPTSSGNVKVYQQETVARLNNSVVNAQGAATVTASDKITASNLAGGAQLSGAASVGVAAAFTFSNAHVFADIKGGSLTASSLTLTGSSGALDSSKEALITRAYNGAIGMGAGVGAAVAVAVLNNQVGSTLGGTLNLSSALRATLNDDLKVKADGVGAAAGAVGVGIVLAVADRNSAVNLALQDGASLTAQTISLSSTGKGSVSASGTGAAGGLLGAGNAVVTVASDSSTVKTVSGNNVTFNAGSGGLSLSASAQPDVYSKAIGATLAGMVGVGASAATALGDATVEASLGNNNTLLGGNGLTLSAALQTPAGDDPEDANVRAYAIAGTGGLYFAANGSVAVAKNESSVAAKTGSNLKLPGGRIQISADSATHQYADALGVAAGGLAVGASLATAISNTRTDVTLGSAMTASTGVTVGDVVFTATADDLNEAKSVAGSGGLIAGNASVAKTDTDGEAKVSVGSGSNLTADSFSINAAYSGRYGAHANSVNAAVFGGSGAGTENTLDGRSTVSIGSSASLNARRDLLIAARNTFATHSIDGSFVSGAGGGVISGQAVTNRTTINGNALVEIGQNAGLTAGSDSADTPGKLMVRAYTIQTTSEDITLSTGGAIAGGGASNRHTSNLTNTVQVNTGAKLNSYGELGLGTYTLATASIDALVSTWGLAGVGVADATVHLNSNQNVTIAANAMLEAFGSITIAAGKDPESLWQTRLTSNANAQSTVRGLIAIPDATADSKILNNTRLSVASGAQVLAARNINLGGYNGYSDALGDGTGRGYQLGFIPVTTNDTRTGVTKSSYVTLDGTFLAGRYNELVLTIDANGTLSQASGLTVAGLYDASFNPTTYVNSLVGMDATVQQILLSTLSTSATGAWILGPMFAAGGDVTVQADHLDGAGSITANGGPKIQVTNNSRHTLVLGSAVIPENTGGHALFTGGAGAVQFGASKIHEVNVDRRAQLLISNTYTGGSGNSSYGPAIFLTDDLFNLSGLIHISNAKGSLGQFGSTYGQQVLVEVPEGSMTVFRPSEYWSVGSNPLSEWTGFSDMGSWSANTAISLIANAYYGSAALANNNAGLLYQGSSGDNGGQSVVLFGGCLPASLSSGSNCSGGTPNSYTGSSVRFHGMTNTDSAIPIVPILAIQKKAMSYESANLSGSQSSQQIVGGQVGIQARYVDINATISSGQATTRTLTIGSSLDNWLATHYCASHTCTSLVDIPVSHLTSNGGTLIRAKYDFVNKRIVTEDVNASGGGFVYIKGGVISTNPFGNIRVNNGYGQVTINNLSNAQLQLGNIDTGNGSVGIVQIVDTLKPMVAGQYATTWYVDYQGQGLSILDNRNGASTLAGAYLASTSASHSAQYNPKNGIRYQWVRSASLSRNVDFGEDHFFMSDWVWNSSLTSSAALNGSVVDGNGNTSVYQRDITGTVNRGQGIGVAYHGCGDGIGSNCHWDFKATGRHDDGRLYAGWLYLFPTYASITVTQSVKADNPFNISFVGNATGSINASTTGNLIVAGNLNNPGGTTTLSGGNLSTLADSSIYARDLVLNASGAIGSVDAAFAASLAQGGSLAATSGTAGLHLNLGSAALIKSLKAGNGSGDIVVNALDNLLAASSASNRSADVVGRNVTLNSTTGGIGESGNALRINAVEVARGGISEYGIVNAKANKAIHLQETTGDMWVGQIASETSDVWVKVDAGSLYDAGRRGNQTIDDNARQAIWRKLSLTDDYGAASNIVATSVTPFQEQVNANYREYWSLLGLGSVQGGEFTLSQAGQALYRPMVALKLGVASPTDAQVASYASDRYSALTTAFSTDVGSDWRSQSAFKAYSASFSYIASAAQVAKLSQDAVWTEAELLYAINQNAIDGSASSAIGSSEPSISGRNVALQVAGNIGQLADSLSVSIDDLRKGNLSATQAAALAVATAPGDVRTNKNDNGDIVSLTVNRTLPFYVNATGQFDLSAGGSAFLQSQPDLQVGNFSVSGDARLASAGSILAASGAGNFQIGRNLTLQANSGSLGTVGTTPVALNLNVGGALLAASAGQDVAINWLNGDFAVGQVVAKGDVYLNAGAGSLLQQGNGVAVNGRNIKLTARDSIGGAGHALQIEQQSASSSVLSGSAGQGLWLTTDKALSVGSLSAGQGLSLTSTSTSGLLAVDSLSAGGDLRLDSQTDIILRTAQADGQVLLSSTGNVTLKEHVSGGSLAYVNSQGSFTMDAASQLGATSLQLQSASLQLGSAAKLLASGTLSATAKTLNMGSNSLMQAGGTLSLTTSADMILGQLASTANGGTLFDLNAGGHLSGNGDGAVNLLASNLGDSFIRAGQGIGSSARALTVKLPKLTSIRATQDDIFLTALHDLQGTTFEAEQGNLVVNASGVLLNYDRLAAHGTLSVHGGDLDVGHLQATTGALSLDGLGLVTVDTADIGGVAGITAADATLGRFDSAGAFTALISGDLKLAALTSGDNVTLTIGSGSAIGSLNVTGDLDLNVAGMLDLQSATSTGHAVLHHSGLAGDKLHYGKLLVGDTLDVTGLGDWSGDNADVNGDVRFDVGSAKLGSLLSRNGELSLKASGLFAADVLTSHKQLIDLSAGSAQLGDVSAHTTLTAKTKGDLTILSGRSGADLTLSTLVGHLGNIRFGALADANTSGVLNTPHLKSAANLLIDADGDLFGGNAEAEVDLTATARNMYFGRMQSLTQDILLTADGIYEENNGNIVGLLVEGKRDVGIIAGGNLTMPEVKFGRGYSLKAGRDLRVGIRGDLDINGLAEAGRDLIFTIGGNIDLQGIKAGRNVEVTSGGFINLDQRIDAGGNVSLLAKGGDITIGTGIYSTGVYDNQAIVGDVSIEARDNVTIPTIVAAGGGIDVQGNNLRLTAMTAGADIDLLAGGLIDVDTSRSGGYQYWSAGQTIDFGSVEADGRVDLLAAQNITGDLLSAALINVDGDELRITDLTSATSTDLLADGLIRVSGTSRSGGYQNWKAGNSIDFGNVDAGGRVDLLAAQDITGDQIAANLITVDGQNLRFTDLTATTSTDLLAGGLIRVAGTSRSGGYQNWKADNSIDFGNVDAGGRVDLLAVQDITGDQVAASLISVDGHSLRLTDLTANASTDLLARGLIRIDGTSQSGGYQNWHADEGIFFQRLLAGGQALLDSLLTTEGRELQADKGAVVHAGWRQGVASDADILLGKATAPSLSLWAGTLIRVADANIGQSVDLHGKEIELYGRHTGSGQLNLWVEGSGEALARRFDTRLQAADIRSPRLHAVNSRIQTTGSKVDLQDAAGVDRLALYSAQAVVIADNTTPTYRKDADVQLYELDKAFQLKQDGLTSTTSGYVLHRKFTHQVLVQNFSEQHAEQPGEGMLYQGVSASRYSEQNLSSGFTEKRLADVLKRSAPVLPQSSNWTPTWNSVPMDTRMNLDMGAMAPADDGVKAWEL